MDALRRILPIAALLLGVVGAFSFLRRDAGESDRSATSEAELVPRSIGGGAAERLAMIDEPPIAALDPFTQPRIGHGWVERNNEAVALLEAGDLAGALAIFEECHTEVPESDVFRRNLADTLKRLAQQLYEIDHEPSAAIECLVRVLELTPDRVDADDLRAVLARWRREVAIGENHATDESAYFELSYDADRVDVLYRSGAVIEFLERAYGDLRDWFGADPVIADGRPRIRVVLYDKEQFDALTGLGDWAGGVFDGVIRIAVEDLDEERARWRQIARHELVHAFIFEVGGTSVPGWLNEGLAQWLDVELRPRLVADARGKIADATLFPLDRLQGSLATWDDPAEITLAYAQSLALVHHIAQHYGEHVLRQMIAHAKTKSPTETFRETIGVPLSFVVEDLPNYF